MRFEDGLPSTGVKQRPSLSTFVVSVLGAGLPGSAPSKEEEGTASAEWKGSRN